MLADVIPHYDGLSHCYKKICANSDFPLYVQQATDCAWRVLNTYYSKTDESELYRLAICEWTPNNMLQLRLILFHWHSSSLINVSTLSHTR